MDISSMPKAFSAHHSWYHATLSSLSESTTKLTSSSSRLIYTYTHVVHGFCAKLSPDELEALKASPGYVYSVKDRPVIRDTTHSPTFLKLNPKYGAWPASRFGHDVIIGLVDTGVWPESQSFDDQGMDNIPTTWRGACETGTQFNSSMCNKKLIGARFFNKGLIASLPDNATISMNSARDTDGHGTHTSSTAGGNYVPRTSFFGYAPGTATGIAPRARVAMYKALWDEGNQSSDIIAAIDQAIIDGVDVLSLSLGLDVGFMYDDPIAIATFAAMEKGIFVATSAGNEGPFVNSLHNGTPWVLTVAAGTMDREFGAELKLDNGKTITGSALYPGKFPSNDFPIVFMDQCESLSKLNKIGRKIVVCDLSDSIFDQVETVRNATVAGAVFITNITELEFFIKTTFPAIFIRQTNGETIKDYIKSSIPTAKASMKFQITILGSKPAPAVSSYSSRGPSVACPAVLKPDIMAPGSLVLAAWPPSLPVDPSGYNKFNLESGTSMACPQAAGVAALIKSVHPDWSPAAIRSAMVTTAYTNDNTGSPIKDLGDDKLGSASPFDIGGGHMDPNKALEPGLIYDALTEDYLNLLCGLNYTKNQIKTIARSSFKDCTTPSLDLNYPSFIAFFDTNDSLATVKEFHRTVTNVGECVSSYTVYVKPIKGFNITVVPTKLEFKKKNEKKSYKLLIEGRMSMKEVLAHGGYLTWTGNGGKYVVRSPIVVTRWSP
ncbi:hypothetical protein ACFE04_002649 [Oxalis oulophora]